MDQMLLTGLVSSRFSSLADGCAADDSVTAPRLKVEFVGKGNLSERRALEAMGSPIASLSAPIPEASVARTTCRIDRTPASRTVSAKTVRGRFTLAA